MAQVGGLTGGRCRDAGLIEPNLKEKRAAKKRKWSNNGALLMAAPNWVHLLFGVR